MAAIGRDGNIIAEQEILVLLERRCGLPGSIQSRRVEPIDIAINSQVLHLRRPLRNANADRHSITWLARCGWRRISMLQSCLSVDDHDDLLVANRNFKIKRLPVCRLSLRESSVFGGSGRRKTRYFRGAKGDYS